MLARGARRGGVARAPSADDIRVRDQEQLVLEIRALAAEVTDDDRAVAQTLLADRSAGGPGRRARPPAPRGAPGARGAVGAAVDADAAQRGAPSTRSGEHRARRAPRDHGTRHAASPHAAPVAGRTRRSADAAREPAAGAVLVHDQRRPQQERRSEVAHPAALPPRRHHQAARSARSRSSRARRASRSRPTRATRFAEAIRRPDEKDPNIHIEPVDHSL